MTKSSLGATHSAHPQSDQATTKPTTHNSLNTCNRHTTTGRYGTIRDGKAAEQIDGTKPCASGTPPPHTRTHARTHARTHLCSARCPLRRSFLRRWLLRSVCMSVVNSSNVTRPSPSASAIRRTSSADSTGTSACVRACVPFRAVERASERRSVHMKTSYIHTYIRAGTETHNAKHATSKREWTV